MFNSFTTFDLAYSLTKSPQYVSFVLGLVNQYGSLEIDELLLVMNLIKNQKMTIALTSSKAYIDFYASALAQLKSIAVLNKDPLMAIKVFYAMRLFPKGLNTEKLLSVVKPILKDAFNHKNATRSDGLFLTPEQSTAFSLQLINVAWQYHLDKKEMPYWLYELAEKESCRLAYRLEPDGCLPDWSGENKRFSLTQDIYKAALVFDRDDLRFVAYGGRRMENAYPPEQLNFEFPEIGLKIFRNSWDICHASNPYQRNQFSNVVNTFMVTSWDNNVSIYVNANHVCVFEVKENSKDLNVVRDVKLNIDTLEINYPTDIRLNLEKVSYSRYYAKNDDAFFNYVSRWYFNNWTRRVPVTILKKIKL